MAVVTALCAGCSGSSNSAPAYGHLTLWRVWNTPEGGTCPPGTDSSECAAYLKDGKVGSLSCGRGDALCSSAVRLQQRADAGHYDLCLSTEVLPDIHVTGHVKHLQIDFTVTPCMAKLGSARADTLTIDRAAGI